MKDKDLSRLFELGSYRDLVKKNNFNTIDFLLGEGIEFYIVTFTNVIDFNPPVPEDIIKFDNLAIFAIANYTFESSILDNENLYFETGFGQENYGSNLTIPLEAIHQIVVDDVVIATSYFKPKPKPAVDREEKTEVSDSMSILLNHPENLHLLKRKKGNKK